MVVVEGAGNFAEGIRDWRQRRRVSQLELALAAGTTQRHVSFVESGRSLPGREIVVRLTEALDIPLRHRNALLLAAGYAPAYGEAELDDPSLDPVRNALERLLVAHRPYPAVITDRHGDLVSGNSAFWRLIDGVAPDLLEPPVSVARVLLSPRGLAPRMLNLDVYAWHVIDALEERSLRCPDDRLDGVLGELRESVPARARPTSSHIGYAVPLRLQSAYGVLTLLTTLSHFATTTDVALSEVSLEAFLPGDAATAEALAAADARPLPPTPEATP
ncbi:helix-turn-helix domain-containing protein [Nocardioides sp. CER19]|uniref:helix-turn-helix domain-containing protein n=1 Tax=Nocardioides sp. CER19 TaxID=3038538 RepID=UPI00244C02D5|nr:helix-turn-helix domain-containing protein [Nocardioides sp. CER19]MDH2413812.1 helix-turn-helix domain-containing protein [Nocardioides sp. CER19]